MSQDTPGTGEILDKETSEVLDELEAEGHEIEGREPKEKPEAKEEPAQPKETPKEAKPEPEEKPEPEAPKGEDEETPEEEPAKFPKAERPIRAVPVKKFNDLRHKLQEERKAREELEAKVKGLVEKPEGRSAEEIADITVKLAQKYELDQNFVKDLVESVSTLAKRDAVPADVLEKLKDVDAFRELNQKQQEETAFEADFTNVSKEFPDLAEHKDALKELAYTEGNETTPLRTLAIAFAHDQGLFTKGRKTAEGKSAAGKGETEVIDFENVSEEQFKNLTPEQMDRYLEYTEAKEKKARGAL